MNNTLGKRVSYTLNYFKQFDYPLTLVELKRWLLNSNPGFGPDVQAGLAELNHYFFRFSACSADEILGRNRKYMVSEVKRRKARRCARIFKWLPFVKAVAVSNRVGWGTADEGSDIDFFIIASPGRIFLARLLVAGISEVLGLRVSEKNPGGLCLSFYAAGPDYSASPDCAASCDFERLKCRDDDVHFAYWLMQIMPIWDSKNFFQRVASSNMWLKNFFSSDIQHMWNASRVEVGKPYAIEIIEFILSLPIFWHAVSFFERVARKFEERKFFQRMKIESANKTTAPVSNAVIWDEQVIKLHWNDAREKYYSVWKKNINGV